MFFFSLILKSVIVLKSLCFSQSNYTVINDNQSDTFGLIFFSTLWKIQAYIFYSSMPIQPITHKKKINRMISSSGQYIWPIFLSFLCFSKIFNEPLDELKLPWIPAFNFLYGPCGLIDQVKFEVGTTWRGRKSLMVFL